MNQYQEKELLGDALSTQKSSTNLYNTCANECVHEDLRMTMLDILADEHTLQQEVFCTMHEKGYYPTPAVEQKKVDETIQRFSAAYKPL